ncbi:MAG: hypothetical protein K0S65_6385 [Labilithrix sp.]|nr:hypothetical protein [Labilithrix sp.]
MSTRHFSAGRPAATLPITVGVLALLSGLAVLAACATDGQERVEPGVSETKVPSPDAATDGGVDADAGPCEDCEYFPETCSADVLCSNELFAASGSFDPRNAVSVIRGRSESDVWLGAALGVVAHFDGAKWTRADVERESIRAFWLREDGEISFPTLERLFSRGLVTPDGGAPSSDWTPHAMASWPTEYGWWSRLLNTTWATPGAEWTWAATEAMSCTNAACGKNPDLRTSGLWRVRRSPSGAFEITRVISHDVCQATSCEGMTSLHASSATTLWAVGHTGAAIRITDPDSETPTLGRLNTQTWLSLYGVWGASDTDVWAVGAHGVVRHYTGHAVAWDVVSDVPTTQGLNAVWGSSASDVWAVGDAGTVLHYDGKAWSRVKIAGLGARRPKLTTVWLASPGHVWIGGQGVVLSLGGKP